jgi:hypothetical protein
MNQTFSFTLSLPYSLSLSFYILYICILSTSHCWFASFSYCHTKEKVRIRSSESRLSVSCGKYFRSSIIYFYVTLYIPYHFKRITNTIVSFLMPPLLTSTSAGLLKKDENKKKQNIDLSLSTIITCQRQTLLNKHN